MVRLIVTISLILMISEFLQAQGECVQNISHYQKAIRCAEELSPEVQRAQLEVLRSRAQVSSAKKMKNPEFSVDTLHGQDASGSASETEVSLGIPLELGGKVAARTSLAESEVTRAEAALFEVRAVVRTTAILNIHRLRQLLHEQEVVDEALLTFSKLMGQYVRRPRLSPEHQVTRSVFQMAKSEYELKKVELLDELSKMNSYLKVFLGADVLGLKGNLPDSPKVWPKLQKTFDFSASPRMKLAVAAVESAQAELRVAQSESWPTLLLGPSLKLQSEAGRTDQFYGLNLSLPLPIFSSNQSSREVASSSIKVAESSKQLVAREQMSQREVLAKTYEQSTAALGSILSHEEIVKRHSEIEHFFLRGTVPSSLIIEAHRTYLELEKARNERELKALEAFLALHVLEGKLPENIQ